MTWTIWIALGSILGGLSVVCGAFGAHALRERLSPENMAIFEIGARYQMYHAFALIAVGLISVKIDHPALKVAGYAFFVGTLIFSGSLYILALSEARIWGAITPIGGAAFILGWAALAFAVLRPI